MLLLRFRSLQFLLPEDSCFVQLCLALSSSISTSGLPALLFPWVWLWCSVGHTFSSVAFKPSLIGIPRCCTFSPYTIVAFKPFRFGYAHRHPVALWGGGVSPSNSWPSLCRMLVLLRTLFHTVMCPLFGRQQIVCGLTALVFWSLICFLGGGDFPPRFLVVLLGSL